MPTITEATKKGSLPTKGTRPELAIWEVTLDAPGTEHHGRTAEMLRKPDSPAPTGEVTVEQTEYGLKAKAVQQGFQGRSFGRRDDSEWDPFHPRQKLIVRQSSIKAAVEMVGPLASEPRPFDVEKSLERWIDWFERKTWKAVSGEGEGSVCKDDQGNSASLVASPSPDPEPNGEVSIVQVLMQKTNAGLSSEDFKMMLVACGCEDLQKSTLEQRVALMNRMEATA